MGRLAVHSLGTGDRQSLPAGLLPAPSPSPAGMKQTSEGLATGTRAALGGDMSILLIPHLSQNLLTPSQASLCPALVGTDPNPAVEKGVV